MSTSRTHSAIRHGAAWLLAAAGAAHAQSLNWEGQTGVFVTPLAYTAGSPNHGAGKPVVAYHFLNAGDVLGNFHTASVTEGLFGRAEFGYTRVLHQEGSTVGLSNLWQGGFNIVHGKVNLLRENTAKTKWVPAISAGFVARTPVRNVAGVLANRNYSNADFYLAATKTVTQVKGLPLVFNLGYKATNASVFSLAGNAPAYKGRLFGAAAFVVKGPARSQIVFASEFAQQPRDVRNLPGAIVPTTLTYAARIVPFAEHKFNIDFGVAQAAGHILPGVDLHARHQFALGVSYGL
jgi:hypothetical protein